MEEEADAAEDEAEDEHEVDEEPGQDQAAVVARGGNHEEDRGGEAEEEGGEDPGEDGGGEAGAEEVAGGGEEPGVGQDEDKDRGAAQEEILHTQTRPQHLEEVGGAVEAGAGLHVTLNTQLSEVVKSF